MRHHHANAAQRAYRSRRVRIDYASGEAAASVLDALRAESGHLTNRAVLDAIVTDWAAVNRPEFLDVSTGARMTLAGTLAKPTAWPACVWGDPAQGRPALRGPERARQAAVSLPWRCVDRTRDGRGEGEGGRQPAEANAVAVPGQCRRH